MTKPWEGEYSCSFSIRKTCEDVGITPAKKTFAEVYPTADGLSVIHRIAAHKDATKIYIKRTIPTMPE